MHRLTSRPRLFTVNPMNRWSVRISLVLLVLVMFPYRSPAPLIYRPGEGWSYEKAGDKGDWRKDTAKSQTDIAKQALEKKDYGIAFKAARRVVKNWPLSDYAPEAQYLLGRAYEARKQDQNAFKAYQEVLEKYPKVANYQEIQKRQFEITTRFLHGQRFKLLGYIPFLPSMDRTAQMFEKIVKDGPYGEIAPQAEMGIGAAREKQKNYASAVKAYERAADRYSEQKQVASDALYKAGMAYKKQATTADYDQSVAGQAISTFTDFMTLYPDDPRVPEAQKVIAVLKSEQAHGNFEIAKFYEKKKHWDGALIYYNEVLLKDAGSPLAAQARVRIDALKQHAVAQ